MEYQSFVSGPDVQIEGVPEDSILIHFDDMDDGNYTLIQVANRNCSPEQIIQGAVALLENVIMQAKEDGIPDFIVKGLIAKYLTDSSLYGKGTIKERGN